MKIKNASDASSLRITRGCVLPCRARARAHAMHGKHNFEYLICCTFVISATTVVESLHAIKGSSEDPAAKGGISGQKAVV